ncbi:MAG: 2-dehydropantoate 2-reductase [Pseudomonadota bacterium]|nr:2-dehydropantoate 2-reductase [Pseudomonadota bacterium]
MKITIFGVGAVAGFVAGRLARIGHAPALIARGDRLDAYRENGLTLIDLDRETQHQLPATDDTGSLGEQDLVLIGAKAHAIPGAVDQISPLLGSGTTVVPMINGIPFWYFHGVPGDWPKRHLDAVDPGARAWSGLGIERVLGCVVYVMNTSPSPGVIQNHGQEAKFAVGEPAGKNAGRIEEVSSLFRDAGFDAPVSDDIRRDLWVKLWGNLSGNSISAIAEGTCSVLGADPAIRSIMAEMMRESVAVAAAYGVELAADAAELEEGIARRIEYFRNLGDVPTSMLQDYQSGRTLELDPIVGAVREMGEMAGVPTPTIDTIYALARKKAEVKGLYRPLAR